MLLCAARLDAQSPIDSPAGLNSGEPNLAVGADGTTVLSWLEHKSSQSASVTLRFAVLEGEEWVRSTSVAKGENWLVNWADFPSVVPVFADFWAAHWLIRQAKGGYAYDIAISLSADAGRSWGKPLRPHHDGTATEHGFVSLYRQADRVGALWLDGRNMEADPERHKVDGGGTTLRSATISLSGDVSEKQIVDELACDCCQTDVAQSVDGVVAVYRNRTVDEIRDIHVARMVDGQWQPGELVARDGWAIKGCPVNGPAVDARGRDVVVGWYTAARDQPRIRFARSRDSGHSFETVLDVDGGAVSGRVDVALFNNGDAAVSWLRKGESGPGEWVVAIIDASGAPHPAVRIRPTANAPPGGVPQMVSDGARLIFAWTDGSGSMPRVMTAVATRAFLVPGVNSR